MTSKITIGTVRAKGGLTEYDAIQIERWICKLGSDPKAGHEITTPRIIECPYCKRSWKEIITNSMIYNKKEIKKGLMAKSRFLSVKTEAVFNRYNENNIQRKLKEK